jgi:hypothetical protein
VLHGLALMEQRLTVQAGVTAEARARVSDPRRKLRLISYEPDAFRLLKERVCLAELHAPSHALRVRHEHFDPALHLSDRARLCRRVSEESQCFVEAAFIRGELGLVK